MTDTPNYLSADALKIQEWERTHLIALVSILPTLKTDGDFETDQLYGSANEPYRDTDRHTVFNLNVTSGNYDCGTACCIGGWVKFLDLGLDMTNPEITPDAAGIIAQYVGSANAHSNALKSLYWPDGLLDDENWDTVTGAQAAIVIDHFLKTGLVDYEVAGLEYSDPEDE